MRWVLRLIATGDDARCLSTDLVEICRPEGLGDIANLGLTLPEAKQVLASVQRAVVSGQVDRHGLLRPCCRSCAVKCHLKDWRGHCIATLFGEVTVRLPRFLCPACNRTETGVCWPSRCRSTPELDQLQAHLSALMTYRVAAGVLQHLLPIDAGRSPETLRHHTLRIGEQLGTATADQPTTAAAAAITVSVDSTFIRSREEGERHLEVRVGNVETASGGRQVFGAVAKADTDLSALIRQNFRAVGRTDDTEVTAFTDGCPGLRSILVDAGITTPPILDWFHIAMRMQHATQTASGLPADDPDRMQAKSVIVEEVERLRWRIWNGKAKNAKRSIDRVRKVMHVYKEERGHNMRSAPSHRLWHTLLDVDGYLRSQSSWLVNYAKRYRAGLRVGTSITEGTANFLVNRRMNKSQQMRWSRTRCRSPASGPLRGLQWSARLRIGPPVSAACQPERAVGQRGMIPHSLDTSPAVRHLRIAKPDNTRPLGTRECHQAIRQADATGAVKPEPQTTRCRRCRRCATSRQAIARSVSAPAIEVCRPDTPPST